MIQKYTYSAENGAKEPQVCSPGLCIQHQEKAFGSLEVSY